MSNGWSIGTDLLNHDARPLLFSRPQQFDQDYDELEQGPGWKRRACFDPLDNQSLPQSLLSVLGPTKVCRVPGTQSRRSK